MNAGLLAFSVGDPFRALDLGNDQPMIERFVCLSLLKKEKIVENKNRNSNINDSNIWHNNDHLLWDCERRKTISKYKGNTAGCWGGAQR